MRGGVEPGLITIGVGVVPGGRVGEGRGVGSSISSGVGGGPSVAVGDGLGRSVGEGDGVRRFALKSVFTFDIPLKLAFALKLKLLSLPRFVFTATFWLSRYALKLVFTFRFSPGPLF